MSTYPAAQCEYAYPHAAHKVYGPPITRCPGVRVPDELRHYTPGSRRNVLTRLRRISAIVHHLVNSWNVTGLTYVGNGFAERPRRVEEYPENSAEHWFELARYCDATAARLTSLAKEARDAARHVQREAASELLDCGCPRRLVADTGAHQEGCERTPLDGGPASLRAVKL